MARRKKNEIKKKEYVCPPKYTEDHVRQVYYLALLGATDKQMAAVFGCSISVFEHWKRNKPDFLEALQKGKTIADANVAHAMYRSAIGYSHKDSVILTNRIKKRNDKGKVIEEYTEPLIVDTVKHYPPNPVAGKMWLERRQPQFWKETTNVNINGNINVAHSLDLSEFSEKELELARKLGIKKMVDEIQDIDYEEV